MKLSVSHTRSLTYYCINIHLKSYNEYKNQKINNMAFSEFTSDTINQLMQLVDKHNDEMNEHVYVQMCNLLKHVNENQANKHDIQPQSFLLYRYFLHNIIFLVCKHYDENIKLDDITKLEEVRREIADSDAFYGYNRYYIFDPEIRKNSEDERLLYNQYLGDFIHIICHFYFRDMTFKEMFDKEGDLRKKISDVRDYYQTFHPNAFEYYRRYHQ